MIERLKLYIEKHGLLPSQFADTLGMPRSSFSQLMNGRNKSISDVTIGKIHTAFPNLSIQWLLFGEGEMEANTPANKLHQQPLQQQPTADNHHQAQLSFFDESAILKPEVQPEEKYEQEIEVVKTVLPGEIEALHRSTAVESAIIPQRKITKIMVFYSDNTFETLIPEQSLQENASK